MSGPDLKRVGVTVAELVIAMVIATIIGSSLLGLIVFQSRFTNQMDQIRNARAVSKGVANLLQSEMRMVEVSGGVVAADPNSITLRMPFIFGITCGPRGSATTVSLLPTDAEPPANASFSGYAFRTASGSYTYLDVGTSMAPGTGATCAAASVTTLAGGWMLDLDPAAGVAPGTPVFLYQTLRYDFRPSIAIAGRIGLWRTPMATGVAEEIAAPFDPDSGFRFYVLNAATAQSAPPLDLADIRGIQLVLDGESEMVTVGDTDFKKFNLTVAVFFMNRNN